eukprot:SAG22_NODE_19586_length_273_cov_1.011494_1_plen_72_part_01
MQIVPEATDFNGPAEVQYVDSGQYILTSSLGMISDARVCVRVTVQNPIAQQAEDAVDMPHCINSAPTSNSSR